MCWSMTSFVLILKSLELGQNHSGWRLQAPLSLDLCDVSAMKVIGLIVMGTVNMHGHLTNTYTYIALFKVSITKFVFQ